MEKKKVKNGSLKFKGQEIQILKVKVLNKDLENEFYSVLAMLTANREILRGVCFDKVKEQEKYIADIKIQNNPKMEYSPQVTFEYPIKIQ